MPTTLDLSSVPAQLGIAAFVIIAVLMFLREMREWIIPLIKNGGKSPQKKAGPIPRCPLLDEIDVRTMAHQIDDLHGWLGQRDASGAFSWAVASSLSKLTEILERLCSDVQEIKNRRERES